MSVVAHNRTRFPDSYVEVLGIIESSGKELSNVAIRDLLIERYEPDAAGDPTKKRQIYQRVIAVTEMLHTNGRVKRREEKTERNYTQYLYSKCSD